jgi:hypothetical protein
LRADVIILSALVSSKEVGYFAAANIPLVMIYVVSWLLGGVVLPRMCIRQQTHGKMHCSSALPDRFPAAGKNIRSHSAIFSPAFHPPAEKSIFQVYSPHYLQEQPFAQSFQQSFYIFLLPYQNPDAAQAAVSRPPVLDILQTPSADFHSLPVISSV